MELDAVEELFANDTALDDDDEGRERETLEVTLLFAAPRGPKVDLDILDNVEDMMAPAGKDGLIND